MDYEMIRTDVLIVGGGAAGARAAIEAAKRRKVALLCKGSIGWSGITPLAFTGYSAYTGTIAEDSPAVQMADVLKGGYYLAEPKLVRAMVEAGRQTVQDLVDYGVRFVRERDGFLVQIMPGNTYPRCLRIKGEGASFMEALAKRVQHLSNVTLFPDMYVTQILRSDGRAVGATALDARTGTLRVFISNAVILAAGGCEQLWPHTDCPPESTGDGYAMALRCGAELVDMEQQLFYPTIALYPEPIRGLEISYERCLRVGGGGQLINGQGDVFFRAETFPTRDQLSNLIYQEIAAGRATPHGGVYLDLRGAQSWLKEELPRTLAPFARLVYFGLDPRGSLLEVAPGTHTSLGGVRIDEQACTNIPGLFACGEVAGNTHGANRLAGHALLDTQVFGMIAGASAVAYAESNPFLEPRATDIRDERDRVMSVYGKKGTDYRPFELAKQIRQLMGETVGFGRHQQALEKTRNGLNALRHTYLADVKVAGPQPFNNDWLEALEVANMLDTAELVTFSAMARKETRGTHVRRDCPWTDSNPYHVVVRSQSGTLDVCLDPVGGREG